jgi:hypothetical protein
MTSFEREFDEALCISGLITESATSMKLPRPTDVVGIIRKAGAEAAIVGAHGIFPYTRKPRATLDFNVVVGHGIEEVVQGIKEKWPDLSVKQMPHRIIFMIGDREVIDVIRPTEAVFKLALENSSDMVPTLEMAIVLKYVAIISPNRLPEDRIQDIADLKTMIIKNDFDIQRIADLTSMCDLYHGAVSEITSAILDVWAGKRLSL